MNSLHQTFSFIRVRLSPFALNKSLFPLGICAEINKIVIHSKHRYLNNFVSEPKKMSSRGVLVSKDSVESYSDFPLEASSPPPPRPKTPKSPYGNRLDYFDKGHRGNEKRK